MLRWSGKGEIIVGMAIGSVWMFDTDTSQVCGRCRDQAHPGAGNVLRGQKAADGPCMSPLPGPLPASAKPNIGCPADSGAIRVPLSLVIPLKR